MAEPHEIELKFEVPAGQIDRLERLPLLKAVAANKSSTLLSVYFDTDKQKLRKNGLSLRVRRVDGRHVQTIKQENGRSLGLFARKEWESEIDGRQPDFDAAQDTALAPLLNKKLRRKLKPVFETRVRRKVYPIHRKQSDVELTIDRGTVDAAGRTSPLCEIELELKGGKAEQLFEIARDLGKAMPLRLASKSKAESGYELLEHDKPAAVDAAPIALSPDLDWATAFKTIARSCLFQFAANEAALHRNDAEAVHQMRVGMRRLRAAISLFKAMLSDPQTKAMKAEFKWISSELGPARELDVFMNQVVKRADRRPSPASAMSSIAQDFRRRRAQAIERAVEAASSPRFQRLLLDAAEWIEIGDWTRQDDELARTLRERPVAVAAAEQLRRRRNKIRKQGARLAELDPRHRHKLRIRAKKLRYACEFFADAFAGKKSSRRRKKFIASLKKLQGTLGDLNDIVVHERLARGTVPRQTAAGKRVARRARKAFAAGRLSGREEARFASVMKDAERAYAAFAKAAPFWR